MQNECIGAQTFLETIINRKWKKKKFDKQVFNIFALNSNNSAILAMFYCIKLFSISKKEEFDVKAILKIIHFSNKTKKKYNKFIFKQTKKISHLVETLLNKKALV